MRPCPRKMRLSREGSTYLVVFHCEPLEPVAKKCSNPDCEDEGKFAVAIVVENVLHVSDLGEVPIDPGTELWKENAAIVRLRMGHGQTHCQTRDSHFCEVAMRRQNYLATIAAFRVRVGYAPQVQQTKSMSRDLGRKHKQRTRESFKLAKRAARRARKEKRRHQR
jgi:hypothetical protein